MNRVFFKISCIIELVPNIKIICYPNDSLYSTLIIYLQLPEYGEMQFLLNTLKADDNFIDIGANMGIYSLLASYKIRNGKILAFEPSPKILPQLYENITLNEKNSIISVIQKAASDKTGSIDFDISSNPDYNHISYTADSKLSLRVETITLDKFITNHQLKHVKIIKIDVEGAELIVLRGLTKTFEKRGVDALIVEVGGWTMGRYGITVEDVTGFLRNYGFGIYMFSKDFKLIDFSLNLNRGWNIIAIHKSKNAIVKKFNEVKKIVK